MSQHETNGSNGSNGHHRFSLRQHHTADPGHTHVELKDLNGKDCGYYKIRERGGERDDVFTGSIVVFRKNPYGEEQLAGEIIFNREANQSNGMQQVRIAFFDDKDRSGATTVQLPYLSRHDILTHQHRDDGGSFAYNAAATIASNGDATPSSVREWLERDAQKCRDNHNRATVAQIHRNGESKTAAAAGRSQS